MVLNIFQNGIRIDNFLNFVQPKLAKKPHSNSFLGSIFILLLNVCVFDNYLRIDIAIIYYIVVN